MSDTAMPQTAAPPTPAPVNVSAPTAGADAPVHREPVAPPVDAASTPAAQPEADYRRPEAELRLSIRDQVRTELKADFDKQLAEMRAELAGAARPQPPPAADSAPGVPPGMLEFAKQSLPAGTADDRVQQYAHAQTEFNRWWQVRNDPQHQQQAQKGMAAWQEKLDTLAWRASMDAERTQRQQAEKPAETSAAPQYASTGEMLDDVRQKLTPDAVAKVFPGLGAAIASGHTTVATVIDRLQLHNEQDPNRAYQRLEDALALADDMWAKQTAATPSQPRAPGNPAVGAPTTPATAGHTGKSNFRTQADWAAAQQAAALN